MDQTWSSVYLAKIKACVKQSNLIDKTIYQLKDDSFGLTFQE